MPVKMALPANAKMTAFVCSGRRRPNVRNGGTFSAGTASCRAMSSPTSMPTRPQTKVATRNFRTIASSYLKESSCAFIAAPCRDCGDPRRAGVDENRGSGPAAPTIAGTSHRVLHVPLRKGAILVGRPTRSGYGN